MSANRMREAKAVARLLLRVFGGMKFIGIIVHLINSAFNVIEFDLRTVLVSLGIGTVLLLLSFVRISAPDGLKWKGSIHD